MSFFPPIAVGSFRLSLMTADMDIQPAQKVRGIMVSVPERFIETRISILQYHRNTADEDIAFERFKLWKYLCVAYTEQIKISEALWQEL